MGVNLLYDKKLINDRELSPIVSCLGAFQAYACKKLSSSIRFVHNGQTVLSIHLGSTKFW